MKSNEITDEIMSEIERDKLIAFKDDQIMFQAVKKYVLMYLYQGIAEKDKPFVGGLNYALQLAWDRQGGVIGQNGQPVAFTPKTDAELGADLRALARGINIVESGFQEISKMSKPVEEKKEEVNPAL